MRDEPYHCPPTRPLLPLAPHRPLYRLECEVQKISRSSCMLAPDVACVRSQTPRAFVPRINRVRPSSFCSVYSAVRPMSVRATLRTINGWPNCFRYLSLSFHPCTDSLFQLVSALRSLHLKAEACSRKNSPQQNGILVQGHYPNSQ